MLELIEAGWDFSILKPRRLESRPYTAGALTYSSLGETSLDSRVRGITRAGEGRDARACANYLPVCRSPRTSGHKPTFDAG